jgi:hypothetical protein
MYIEELEQQIQSLDRQLKKFGSILSIICPEKSTDDLEALEEIEKWLLESKQHERPPLDGVAQLATEKDPKTQLEMLPNGNELLETMIEATGRLHIDGQGHCEYHGDFAGLAFLRQIGKRCSQLLDEDFERKEVFSPLPIGQALTFPRFSLNGPRADSTSVFHLPPLATAQRLTEVTLKDASCLMTFIHTPSFDKVLHRIYSVKPEDYTSAEKSFLPLLYITLANGELFVGGGEQDGGDSVSCVDQMKG